MNWKTGIALACLSAAACGSSPDDASKGNSTAAPAAEAAKLPASGNEHHDRLAALSEGDRNSAFAEMLGEQCGKVSRTYFQGLGEADEAFWNVACSTGDKIVGVAADSSTRVAPCESGQTLGMECWKEWEQAS